MIINLSLHCHHQNDSCIKMGSDESHFNVSLILKGKVTRQCPQTTTFLKRNESQSGIEPRSFRLPAKSPFLIGWMFLRETSWKYSSKLYSGSEKLCSTCSGNIRPIRRSLPLIGREQSSPVDEEKTKIKMDDGVARFFTRFGGNLFICWLAGGAALSRRPRMR